VIRLNNENFPTPKNGARVHQPDIKRRDLDKCTNKRVVLSVEFSNPNGEEGIVDIGLHGLKKYVFLISQSRLRGLKLMLTISLVKFSKFLIIKF
jgi:hypothetical protein